MTSDVSEFFFVGSRGNLANYVLLIQVPEPPKNVLKDENKGGTTLVICPSKFLTSVNYTLCCCCCAQVIFACPNSLLLLCPVT